MKAYKCDLCGKLIEDCYGVDGVSLYPVRIRKFIGKDLKERHLVHHVCELCYEKIMSTVYSCFNPDAWKNKFEE